MRQSVSEYLRGLTVGDEGPAREHLPEHELDHGQDDANQAADDGHAEQEVILRETAKQREKVGVMISSVFTTQSCYWRPTGFNSRSSIKGLYWLILHPKYRRQNDELIKTLMDTFRPTSIIIICNFTSSCGNCFCPEF